MLRKMSGVRVHSARFLLIVWFDSERVWSGTLVNTCNFLLASLEVGVNKISLFPPKKKKADALPCH
jgi:hypothetical protein